MIKIIDVSFTYPDGTQAVKNITVSFPREHIFSIMGLSGSGKTTLLNCVARFLVPQKGAILLDDTDIFSMDEQTFRSKVGVVFQHLNLFPHLTVLENLILAPCRVKGESKKAARREGLEILDRLGIMDLVDNYPAQISGGQAQRVAIARGLMLKPEVMLLDEPTSALDAKTTSEFAQWLRELKSDTSFIIVTHDLPFASQCSQKGMFMDNGEIRQFGITSEITRHIKIDL